MISVLATNITSPLGFTTEQNYRAVLSGASALRRYDGLWNLPEPFAASLFSEEQHAALAVSGYTPFESLAIRSVREALSHTQLDVASPRVAFILSTTKGNIGQSPAEAAQRIAGAIGLTAKPIVACNACVSGLTAQLLALHLLTARLYDYAIVVGAEVQGKFIVSGFQSLKAVSEEPCRPFDIERNGLNPGEAAATIIFGAKTPSRENWHLVDGASRNDAFHIVSPSPQGDGLHRAIEAVMEGRDKAQLRAVCVHGTATLYNDQMEAKAIHRSGLSGIPLTALKGYYGHTMGAAGVLETILTMRATDDGIVLPSKGFTEPGVSEKVRISNTPQPLQGGGAASFLKLISGFGGCNVAALYMKDNSQATLDDRRESQRATDNAFCKAQTQTLRRGAAVRISSEDGQTLTEIYRQRIGDYPKFYKMDILSRLAFVAAEQALSNSPSKGSNQKSLPIEGEVWRGSVILFNHSSSIVADRQFMKPLPDSPQGESAFVSPSAFVYTLPNIAAGEIAIRHRICGETSFYILPEKDEALMQQILEATLNATGTQTAISGWVDAESETSYECELSTYETTE